MLSEINISMAYRKQTVNECTMFFFQPQWSEWSSIPPVRCWNMIDKKCERASFTYYVATPLMYNPLRKYGKKSIPRMSPVLNTFSSFDDFDPVEYVIAWISFKSILLPENGRWCNYFFHFHFVQSFFDTAWPVRKIIANVAPPP